jgi:hypothetical protein
METHSSTFRRFQKHWHSQWHLIFLNFRQSHPAVEAFFRDFKQTFGRDHLRSHAPQNVQLELWPAPQKLIQVE